MPAPAGAPPEAAPVESPLAANPPTPGWVIEIDGYHFRNRNPTQQDNLTQLNFIRQTLFRHLHEGSVDLPIGKDAAGKIVYDRFTLKELGIEFPIIVGDPMGRSSVPYLDRSFPVKNPDFVEGGPAGGGPGPMGPNDPALIPQTIIMPRMDFRIQFVWKETPLSVRMKKREDARKAAEAAAAANGDPSAVPPTSPMPAVPSPMPPAVPGPMPVTPTPMPVAPIPAVPAPAPTPMPAPAVPGA